MAVAEQAQGDLYNAICTLQFICTGVKPAAAAPAPARKVGQGPRFGVQAGAAAGWARAKV